MGEQFSADLDRLRALAPGFDRIGVEVKAAVEALRAVVGDDAAPWGNDDTGKAFGKSFVPEQQQAMSDLDSLVRVLQQAGGDLRQLADNFEYQDLAAGRQIRNVGLGTGNGSTPFPGGDGAVPNQTDPNVTITPIATQPAAATARTLPAAAATARTLAAAASPPPSPATVPTSAPAGTGTPEGAPATERRPGQQDRNRSDTNRPGTGGGEGMPGMSLNPAHRADAQRTPPAQASAPTATPSAGASGQPGASAAAKDTAAATATPWSKSAADRPPRVAASGSGASDSPPRMPSRPGARTPRKADKPDRKPAKPTVDAVAESAAARLARELVERHGVRAFGFDTLGVPEEVLTDIVAAVDDILPRYLDIDLRAIGIDELPDGELTRLDWDSVTKPATSGDISDTEDASEGVEETDASPAERVLFTARIVLSARAATDPDYLEQTIAAAESAGLLVPGYARRPVYSSIVCELGGAMDVAGGFRARTAARRALITAYLPRLDAEDRGSLHRTVAGFRGWRAQLSGRSFRSGRFDSAAALAEGFTEMVLNGEQAAPPARVLHRLLVETAGASSSGAGRDVVRAST
ncbi:hypothetical protein [Nocardia sp. NBC_00403]|uniref:hypothetical protein n=1 Tax=Nocardia sp. NBC_00403 TaxID=2975990 RepID=UPI002E245F8F